MKQSPIITSLLDTDLYKLTMQCFALNHKKGRQWAKYTLTCRSKINLIPIKEDVKTQINFFKTLTFKEEEIAYLESLSLFNYEYLNYLRKFNFSQVNFHIFEKDNQLQITVEGPWEDAILVEVPLLAIIQEIYFQKTKNLDDARNKLNIKIKRYKNELRKFKLVDFGTRRRFSKAWHEEVVGTLNKELGANFLGTSNVFLAKKLGIKPIGTMAHEYFQAFQVLGTSFETSQKEALYAWNNFYKEKLNVALTDILGVNVFLNDCDKDLTERINGYRHDSGCPFSWGYRMLAHFSEMSVDPKHKVLVFSDNLNFDLASNLDSEFGDKTTVIFGIGTFLTNDFDSHKPVSLVMKLVGMNGKPTIKVSDEKAKVICEDENFKNYVLDYVKKVEKYPVINIAVDCLIKKNNEYIIIKRGDKGEIGFDQWALCGGFVDYFEKLEDSVKREVFEELKINVFNIKMRKILDNPNRDKRKRIISVLFEAETTEDPQTTNEVKEIKYVKNKNDLKDLNFFSDHKEVLNKILN